MALLSGVHAALDEHSAEVAHLKVIGMADGQFALANLVSSASQGMLSIASKHATRTAEVVVNARVAIDPDLLSNVIRSKLEDISRRWGFTVTIHTLQSFRPGRPVPTHRLVS